MASVLFGAGEPREHPMEARRASDRRQDTTQFERICGGAGDHADAGGSEDRLEIGARALLMVRVSAEALEISSILTGVMDDSLIGARTLLTARVSADALEVGYSLFVYGQGCRGSRGFDARKRNNVYSAELYSTELIYSIV